MSVSTMPFCGPARLLWGLLLLAAALALGAGCASTQEAETAKGEVPPAPPIATEVEVTGLKKEERDVLQANVCSLPRVEECNLKVRRKRARLKFTYRGTLPELRRDLHALPHPGLEVQTATVKLTYLGFDNIPPEVTITKPEPGSVFTESKIDFEVEVPARDTDKVFVGAVEAKKKKKGIYVASVEIADGRPAVQVRALDKTGNEGTASVPIIVDTTPPTLEIKVTKSAGFDRALIEGEVEGHEKVTIDGREVSVSWSGKFSLNVPADVDKKDATVVAVDEYGNESVLKPKLQNGWTAKAPAES